VYILNLKGSDSLLVDVKITKNVENQVFESLSINFFVTFQNN